MKPVTKKSPYLFPLSLVIPVYNENKNILLTLEEIKRQIKTPHETIVVYDFDADTTVPVVKKAKQKYPHLRLVKNTIHKGPSGAIRSGFAAAKGERVLVTMADLCDDLSQVKGMVRLVPKKAGIVCPSRYMKGGKQELKSSLKVWAPRTAGWLLKVFGGIPTYDPTNSYKLYSKEMLDRLSLVSTVSFSVTLEIVVKARALGYNVVEIPTVWKDRQHGKTNFKLGQSLVTYLPWFFYALSHRLSSLITRPDSR